MKPEGQKILYYIGIIVGTLGGLLGMAVAIAASPLFGSIFSLFFIVVFRLFLRRTIFEKQKKKKFTRYGTSGRRQNYRYVGYGCNRE